jgi:hypothetical protein
MRGEVPHRAPRSRWHLLFICASARLRRSVLSIEHRDSAPSSNTRREVLGEGRVQPGLLCAALGTVLYRTSAQKKVSDRGDHQASSIFDGRDRLPIASTLRPSILYPGQTTSITDISPSPPPPHLIHPLFNSSFYLQHFPSPSLVTMAVATAVAHPPPLLEWYGTGCRWLDSPRPRRGAAEILFF